MNAPTLTVGSRLPRLGWPALQRLLRAHRHTPVTARRVTLISAAAPAVPVTNSGVCRSGAAAMVEPKSDAVHAAELELVEIHGDPAPSDWKLRPDTRSFTTFRTSGLSLRFFRSTGEQADADNPFIRAAITVRSGQQAWLITLPDAGVSISAETVIAGHKQGASHFMVLRVVDGTTSDGNAPAWLITVSRRSQPDYWMCFAVPKNGGPVQVQRSETRCQAHRKASSDGRRERSRRRRENRDDDGILDDVSGVAPIRTM